MRASLALLPTSRHAVARPMRPAPAASAARLSRPAPRPLPHRPASTTAAGLASDTASASTEEEDDDPADELTPEELAMAMEERDGPTTTTAAAAAAGEDDEEDEEWAGDEEEEDDADAITAEYDDDGEDDEDDDGGAWADSGPSTPADLAEAADPADASARSLALALASAAASVKAGDVTVLHVAPLVYWTSYLVLATVYSRPQLGAVLAKAEAAGAAPPHARDLGGQANPGRSAWECLDFGDVVLHVLTPAQREFYDIDGFYGAAAEVPVPGEEGGAGVAEQQQWASGLK